MTLSTIFFSINLLLILIAISKKGLLFLHMLQLESYKSKNYIKWYNENENRILSKTFNINFIILIVFILIYFILSRFFYKIFPALVLNKDYFLTFFTYFIFIYYIIFVIYVIFQKRKKQKKNFVFTPRAKRVFATYIVLNIMLILTYFYLLDFKLKHCYLINYCSFKINFLNISNIPYFVVFYLIIIYFSPYIIFLANNFNLPIERSIQKKFYNMAKNKIQMRNDLCIIGITGSFGKTSTKFITGNILNSFIDQKVLITPESYNTTMGVCKVINNELDDKHKLFIVEMGARQQGDIKEIANLVNPDIGIITAIGKAHLETFGTIDNILKTKFELIDSLKEPAIALLNGDNKYIVNYIQKNIKNKYKSIKDNIIFYGIEGNNKISYDIYAGNINITNTGLEFDIYYNKDKFVSVYKKLEKCSNHKKILTLLKNKYKKNYEYKNFDQVNINLNKPYGYIKAKSRFLGKYNIHNILAGVSIALFYNIHEREIEKAIAQLKPVKHRLELIDPKTGILIIDDAFNSNPEGAKMALEVLSSFKERRKVIVTPGIIEMGEKAEEINKEFGVQISKVCDIVILVTNKVSKYIYSGLEEKNFNKNNIYIVNGLKEAQSLLSRILKANDIVLFENDLPDNLEY